MKHILAVGDSFTYGEELESIYDAYPYKLANLISNDTQVINLGKPGSGNKSMIRNVIKHVSENNLLDLVIIGWASPGRMEFADQSGVFDLWPGYSGRIFIEHNQWRSELLDYINKYHSPEHIYESYLLDIILMQSFLKQKNIRYVMTTTCANEYYHNIYYTGMKPLTDLIDTSFYLGWPSNGMAECTQGCKKGPGGHFLEDGHKKVAKTIYEHIRTLNWI